ncbi:MAG: hypothetical protein LBO00_04615 [Zoogloeaceae bacterium]|jgi:hypothetical protein|nr:hypothetical protein [Zoogloeaceae bacterium]
MANTINGIGTTFYGQAKFRRDGSFVTTKWFVLAFFPLFPMKSYRLRRIEDDENSSIPFLSKPPFYELLEELPADGAQVLRVWAYAFIVIPVILFLVAGEGIPIFLKVVFAAILCALPHLLRWFAKSSSGG